MRWFVLIAGLFLLRPLTAEQNHYAQIDSASRAYKIYNLDLLAKHFKANYSNAADRCRAAFSWITWNIGYDVNGSSHLSTIYSKEFPSEIKDSVKRDLKYTDNIAKKVLTSRMAICEGYSRLFEALCLKMDIPCKIIRGYVRTSVVTANTKFATNHAWNAVFINDAWHLIDNTWGAGYVDYSKKQFNKEINDAFFFANPSVLIMDHYPQHTGDALLTAVPDFKTFLSRPYLYRNFWAMKPTQYNYSKGLFSFGNDKTINFSFHTDDSLRLVQIVQYPSGLQTAAYVKSGTITAGKNSITKAADNTLSIHFLPIKNNDNQLIVFINGIAVSEFAIGP